MLKPEGSFDLDDILPIRDFSNETLLNLAERLERSSSFQDFIAREIELDEIWRRVETAMKTGAVDGMSKMAMGTLASLFAMVQEAHDLAGEGEPLRAAQRLRDAMTLTPHSE